MRGRRTLRVRSRRRPLPIVAFVVAAVAAFLMPAVRPDPVDAQATLNSQATLTVLTSPVEVQRASGNRDTASSGATLVVGDRVFTGSGGSAKLTFFQGTEVDIAPDSELMVQEMTQRVSGASTVSFGQAVGSTVAKVASLFNPASRVQVSTQSAVAVIRGTEVETTVTKENIQVFRSNTGSFDVIAGGQTQRVKDGEVTVVPPPPPAPPPPTTRDSKTVGDSTISLPNGSDRPPLPPVPVAEIGKLFEKVAEVTAKDGPRVVATPPVAARDLIDVAQGKPVVLRPLGATPIPATQVPPPPPTVAPPATVVPTPPPATPVPQQSSNPPASSSTGSATPACSTVISTATPTASETRFKGTVVDGSGAPISGACVEAGNYTKTSRASSVTDASGTFRIIVPTPPTSGASSTYAIVAKVDGYTQSSIPTVTAALGQTNNPFTLPVYRNDTTISGSIGSGTSAVAAAGAVASLVIEVPTPTSYTGEDRLRVPVAQGTASSSGAYTFNTYAANTYSYMVAEQQNVAPYAYRSAATPVPALTANSPATSNIVLPTLEVTSALTCQQTGAPCSVTLSGSGWTGANSVVVGAKGPDGVRRVFANVTVTAGSFTSQSLVAQDPTWPVGTYSLFASQGQGVTERYVEWGTNYYVGSTGTTASCGTNVGSSTATSSVTITGTITNSSGTPIPYACVQVTADSQYNNTQSYSPVVTFARTNDVGAFTAVLTADSGTFYVVPSKAGYTAQAVVVATATAGQVTSLANQNIRLLVNDATVTGTINSGSAPTVVGSGTKVGVSISAPSNRYSFIAASTQTSADGTYTFGLASAASGTYRITVFQADTGGYSMRSFDAPLGPVSGTVTRAITLPTLSASGSCPTGSSTCSVQVSGVGWFGGRDVQVNGAGSGSGSSYIDFGHVTATNSGNITGSLSGSNPQTPGAYSIIALQDGPNGEAVQVAVGPTTYSVASVRTSSVSASPSPTQAAPTVLAAPSTVVASPTASTGTPAPATPIPTASLPAVPPTVAPMLTPTPTP